MRRIIDARKVAAGAALIIAIGAIGVWAEGPAVLVRVHPGQDAASTGGAPPRAAAAELEFGAPTVSSAALPAMLLPSAPLTLAEARARWLASDAAQRAPDASAARSRHPEP